MQTLPEADPETARFFADWLTTFAGYVREVDYASAKPLFHPDVLAFGTHNDVMSGIESWVATQWDNVWPKTTDFRFDLDGTAIISFAHTRLPGSVFGGAQLSSHPEIKGDGWWRLIRPTRPHRRLSSSAGSLALHITVGSQAQRYPSPFGRSLCSWSSECSSFR